MKNIQFLIDDAVRRNVPLIREASCRKCTSEAGKGKERCGYCHMPFDYIVRPVRIESVTAVPIS